MRDATGPATVHVLTAVLRDVRPPVRRRLEVPSGMTLGELSVVLREAFGWDGDHLHQFEVGRVCYAPPEPGLDGARNEGTAVLGRLLPRPGAVATWTYDFGDDWRHSVTVDAVRPADPGAVYPRCTAGSGLAPEEDTGRTRPGTFDDAERERLNAGLARMPGRPGRELSAERTVPDLVFAGIFPELDTDAEPGCDCDECAADDDDLPSLPVQRPQPDDVLAGAAARTPLLRRAVALAGWLGAGRALTPAKVLRPADAADAVARLELDGPLLSPHEGADPLPFGRHADGRGARSRSAKNLPALHPLWCAAVAAGLVEIRGQKAVPGPGLALWQGPSDPSEQVESWSRLLAGYLGTLAETERADRDWYVGREESVLARSVLMLYTGAEAPLSAGLMALGSFLLDDEEDIDVSDLLAMPGKVARWAGVLEQWAMAGVVAPVGQEPSSDAEELEVRLQEVAQVLDPVAAGAEELFAPMLRAVRSGPVVEVTWFGRHVLARVLRGHGRVVPVLGDLVDTPAGELLDALHGRDPESGVEEFRGWLDARGEGWERAVRDVVRSATVKDEAGPPRRVVLPVVIGAVAERAGALVAEWAADPMLGAAVALGRAAAGRGPRPTPAQLLWMAVDSLSVGLDDEDDFADLMEASEVETVLAVPGAMAAVSRVDHPHAREVLWMLADQVDDEDVARRLRKALKGRGTARRR